MNQQNSLEDVVIVNESDDEHRPGDVTVFRSAQAACAYLEHWWVEGGYGSARGANGDRLLLAVDDGKNVFVERREPCPNGVELVQIWLLSAGGAVLAARRAKVRKRWTRIKLSEAEQAGVLPRSIQELISYVGFST